MIQQEQSSNVKRSNLKHKLRLAVAGSMAITLFTFKPALAQQKPNIVVILADDLGYADLGSYGSEIPTPNLDKLAANGIRFTQFYNTARCCPSRATLLTGLYSHQAGVGHMTKDAGADHEAYRGQLNNKSVTIAEALKGAGYFTAMTGKWHVGFEHGVTPAKRGFDRSLAAPAGGFYYADKKSRLFLNGRELDVNNAPEIPKNWYSTDLWTDYGLKFIDEATKEKKPFLLYLAHNAPHFPLQAPEEEIAKFRGKYLQGWDKLRAERYKKQIKLGLIDPSLKLAPDNPVIYKWDTLSDAKKKRYDDMMAVYAAVISHLDTQIGVLVDGLKKRGVFDNTVILFVSDNGGNAEPGITGRYDGENPGQVNSDVYIGQGWAQAACTPFWMYKHHTHEGGISSPAIVSWPAGIPKERNGKFEKQPAHLVDILPTLLDLGQAKYPTEYNGNAIQPYEGVSIKPAFAGQKINRTQPIFWEHEGNRAIRDGKWKLVAERSEKWQLYDLDKDRSELKDLSNQYPDIAAKLEAKYNEWYKKVKAEEYPEPLNKWFYDYNQLKAGK